MNTLSWTLTIAGILLFTIVIWKVSKYATRTYNKLIQTQQNIKNRLSNIKAEYQRRADLLINLMEVTRSHATFEKSTMTNVISMRNGKFPASVQEMEQQGSQLNGILGRLLAVVEQYPELQSIQEYKQLGTETRVTENRVNEVRQDYNGSVREFNLIVCSFPSNIVAKAFNFHEATFYFNEDNTEKAIKYSIEV